MTNLGGFGENTTLGVITGDIKGGVGVQILGMTTADGTITVKVQHLCLAKTLSVPEINSLRNFLNRKICYDYGPCSTFRGYV